MSRQSISLKARVRYEGRVKTIDRRARQDTDFEHFPRPLGYMVSQVLRAKFKPMLKKATG